MNYKVVFLFAFFLCGAFTSFAQLERIKIIADNDVICEGDTVQLNIQILQTGNNNLQFEWDNQQTLNNNAIVNPRAFPLVITLYHVTVTDLDNNVVLKDSMEIIVVPKPEVYAGDAGTICKNQAFIVLNAFTNNSIEFSWRHNGLGVLTETDTYSPAYVPADGELGEVNIILTTGGILYCNDVSDTLKLQIAELPTVSLDIASDTICNNESFVFTEPTLNNVQNFLWTHNGQGTLINSHTTTPEYIPDEFESGKVNITIICNGTASCTQVAGTLSLFIGESPSIDIAQKEVDLCYGNSIQIQSVSLNNSSGFEWEHNGSGVLADATTISPTYIPNEGEMGNVQLVLTAHGSNNCSPVSDTINMEVSAPQEISITKDTMVCSNQTLVLSVPEGLTYLWSTNETTATIEVNPKVDTFFTVTTTNDIGCVLVDTINVTVSDMEIEYTNDPLICDGEEVTIAVVFSNDHIYSWDTGETSNAITVSPQTETTYMVTVTNGAGCVATAEIKVSVNESPFFDMEKVEGETAVEVFPSTYTDYTFLDDQGNILQSGFSSKFDYGSNLGLGDFISIRTTNDLGCSIEEKYFIEVEETGLPPGAEYNAFSPNGDGINEKFLNGQRIVVIDRSDKILFDGNTGWDGRSGGKDMPAGTYYFVAYNNSGDVVYKGSVTIVH